MSPQTPNPELSTPKPTIPILPALPKTRVPITKQSSKKSINLHLIKTCALLANSEPARALEFVKKALCIAEEKGFFHEISKCYLYRGLCFMGLERWREARVALVRGVNVRGWGARVEGLMREVQGNLEEERRLVGKKGQLEG